METKESLSAIAGKNLKILIKTHHLTQEQASTLLHIEERTLRRWIKDGIDKLSSLELICRVFNVDLITTLLKE